jgi:hypothetical protein
VVRCSASMGWTPSPSTRMGNIHLKNILSLKRLGDQTGSPTMDDLSYNYYSNTNRLEYVDDAVGSGVYSNDIDDQASGNYTYDAIGNLISDVAEGISALLHGM